MVVIKSLEKHKYYVSYYIIIHSDSFNVSATGNKEGISMEYLDIKGQKTPTKVKEIPVNTHQHSWKINLGQYHICCGLSLFYFVCFLFGFYFPTHNTVTYHIPR